MYREWWPIIVGVVALLMAVGIFAIAYSVDHSYGPETNNLGGGVKDPSIDTGLSSESHPLTEATEPSATDLPTEATEGSSATNPPTEATEPAATEAPTEATVPATTEAPTEATEPPATEEPTEVTEPDATEEPTEATEPPAAEEPTEATESTDPMTPTEGEGTTETQPNEPETPPTTEPDVLLTYSEYLALTPQEQHAYFLSFPSPADYVAWFDQAKAEYEASKDDIVIEGGGNLDIGDLIGSGG